MLGEANAFLQRAPLAADRGALDARRQAAPARDAGAIALASAATASGSSTTAIASSSASRPASRCACAAPRRARAARRRTPAAARAATGGRGAAARAAPRRCTAPRRAAAACSDAGPICSCIQRSRNGFAVTHRSSSGSSCRPRPSTLSSVFCSSTSCGWISTLKRRDARKSCISTRPSEISRQRPVEHGLQHDADLRLELVDARVRRHPARFEVRGRDAVVVAAEEREEVLREIALVALRQRAHDAEVDRDVLAVVGAVDRDEDVARVHVGVEIAVAEHLREEHLDAGAREPLQVDAGLDAAGRPGRSECRPSAPSPSLRCRSSPSAPRGRAAAANAGNCAAAASSSPPRA